MVQKQMGIIAFSADAWPQEYQLVAVFTIKARKAGNSHIWTLSKCFAGIQGGAKTGASFFFFLYPNFSPHGQFPWSPGWKASFTPAEICVFANNSCACNDHPLTLSQTKLGKNGDISVGTYLQLGDFVDTDIISDGAYHHRSLSLASLLLHQATLK